MFKIKTDKLLSRIGNSGLSVNAWAIQNGFSQSSVQYWITGKRNISQKTLLRLCNAFVCKPEDISEPYASRSLKNRLTNFEKLSLIEKQTEKLCCIYRILNDYQREKILSWAEAMLEQNELKARKEWGLNEK